MRKIFLLPLILFITSCQLYKNDFGHSSSNTDVYGFEGIEDYNVYNSNSYNSTDYGDIGGENYNNNYNNYRGNNKRYDSDGYEENVHIVKNYKNGESFDYYTNTNYNNDLYDGYDRINSYNNRNSRRQNRQQNFYSNSYNNNYNNFNNSGSRLNNRRNTRRYNDRNNNNRNYNDANNFNKNGYRYHNGDRLQQNNGSLFREITYDEYKN